MGDERRRRSLSSLSSPACVALLVQLGCAVPEQEPVSVSPKDSGRIDASVWVTLPNEGGQCGPASGVVVARSLGIALPTDDGRALSEMRRGMGVPDRGATTARQLTAGLRSFGLDAEFKRASSLDRIRTWLACGCRVVLTSPPKQASKSGHAVAVLGVDGESWRVFDIDQPEKMNWTTAELERVASETGAVMVTVCRGADPVCLARPPWD